MSLTSTALTSQSVNTSTITGSRSVLTVQAPSVNNTSNHLSKSQTSCFTEVPGFLQHFPNLGARVDQVPQERLDFDVIAAILARVSEVDAVYKSKSEGETHIWTILRVWSEEALNAVFDREMELSEYFGDQLATVEFHVLQPESVARYQAGWSEIFRNAG